MFSRLRKSFQQEAETDEQNKDSRRSYLNVRDFLDELEVEGQSLIIKYLTLTFTQNIRLRLEAQ